MLPSSSLLSAVSVSPNTSASQNSADVTATISGCSQLHMGKLFQINTGSVLTMGSDWVGKGEAKLFGRLARTGTSCHSKDHVEQEDAIWHKIVSTVGFSNKIKFELWNKNLKEPFSHCIGFKSMCLLPTHNLKRKTLEQLVLPWSLLTCSLSLSILKKLKNLFVSQEQKRSAPMSPRVPSSFMRSPD